MSQPSSKPRTSAAALNAVTGPTAAAPANAANPSPGPPRCHSLTFHARLADALAGNSKSLLRRPGLWQSPYAHGCTSPVRGNTRIRACSPSPLGTVQPVAACRSLQMAFDAAVDDNKNPTVAEAALAVLLRLPDAARAEAAALLSAPRSDDAQGSELAAAAAPAAAADQQPARSQSEDIQTAAAAVGDGPDPATATASVEVAAPGYQPSVSNVDISLAGVALGRVSIRMLVQYCLDMAATAARK